VHQPFDHRQQQLLRCEQQTGASLLRDTTLCSVLHNGGSLFPPSGAVLWQTPFQVGPGPPLLLRKKIAFPCRLRAVPDVMTKAFEVGQAAPLSPLGMLTVAVIST